MKLVVDTNIVFSAILNQKSRIGQILMLSHPSMRLYSCSYLKYELQNYHQKLADLTEKPISDIVQIEELVTKKIRFIDAEMIEDEYLQEALGLTHDVDEDDLLFVALALRIKGRLWTGDKKLEKGLIAKGFDRVITTQHIFHFFVNTMFVQR